MTSSARGTQEPAASQAVRLERLAGAAARTSYARAPAEVRERVRELVVDTLAVTAWGSRRVELAALREVTTAGGPQGRSTVLGTSLAQPAALACALNGSAVAADQLQDGHRRARGHPASHVVLAVLAVAEERNSSSEAMLSAVLAGYEVGTRLGMAMGGTPPGVHDIGTWGSVAAAVATAHLISSGDAAVLARAIELAAANLLLSDAQTLFEGHDGGHAFLGASIAHGLWLGQAASAGLSAAPGTLDRFLAPHAAADWSGLPLEGETGWQHHEALRGYIKLHPTCAHLHGVLDALDDILRAHPGEPLTSEVERVRVRTYAAASAFAAPAENELQARFSIPTSVALTLRHGALTDDALTDEEVRSPVVRRLAALVEVEHEDHLDDGYPAGRPTTVELVLRDGSRLHARSGRPRGDEDGGSSRGAFADKAADLLHGVFGRHADSLLAVLGEWPERHDPRDVGERFRLAAAAREQEQR